MDQYAEKDYVKIAVMYYDEGLTQAEIAQRLNVSRSLISKMLIEAREAGIVEVFVNSRSVFTAQLECRLEAEYRLKQALVLDTADLAEAEMKRQISWMAANYIDGLIRRTDSIKRIGISWGETLAALVNYLPFSNYPDTAVCPLIGGMGSAYFYLHSNQIVHEMARRMRAKAHYLYAPAMLPSQTLKNALVQNAAIADVLKAGSQSDLALVSVAALSQESTMIKTGYIDENDMRRLQESGVIGDVNSRFFDDQGREVDCSLNKRVIGVDISGLRKIPFSVGVAYGSDKAEPLRAALKAGLFNILITTDQTAQELLGE